MRALVTGSTGLLGNHLVRTLCGMGHEVVALARTKEKALREIGDTPARIVVGDMADVELWAHALSGVDTLFHAAAYFREYYLPGEHEEAVRRINVDASLALARLACRHGVKKMVHVSSAGLIGQAEDGQPGRENTPPWNGVRNNLYLKSKPAAEEQLKTFAKETGFFVAFALPAWMWGPHDAGPTASGQLAIDALQGRLPPAIPPGGASVVDARDVAEAMIRIAEIGRAGERYVLAARYMELADLVERLAEAAGVPAPKARMPYAAALAFAIFAQAWSRVTHRPSPVSIESLRLMHARLSVSSDKARRELGATFRSFEQTLQETVAWSARRLGATAQGRLPADAGTITPPLSGDGSRQ